MKKIITLFLLIGSVSGFSTEIIEMLPGSTITVNPSQKTVIECKEKTAAFSGCYCETSRLGYIYIYLKQRSGVRIFIDTATTPEGRMSESATDCLQNIKDLEVCQGY